WRSVWSCTSAFMAATLMAYHAPSRFSSTRSHSLCMYFGAAHLCELFKQVALFLGEVHGQHDFEAREEVAVAFTAQAGHAFPRQAEDAAILCFWRDGEHEFAPIW